jgi:YidC/Oxa1 family membrane protein insertase
MTSNYLRVFLWAVLGVALWLNYEAWVADNVKAEATAAVARAAQSGTPAAGVGLGSSIPRASGAPGSAQSAGSESAPPPTAPPQAAGSSQSSGATGAGTPTSAGAQSPAATASRLPQGTAGTAAAPTVHVRTDVLDVELSLKGGTLVRAALPKYPLVKGQPQPVVLENDGSPDTLYLLESGLTGPDDAARPTHLATFESVKRDYTLPQNADELRVPLTWTDGHGVTVTKTFVFHRGRYSIDLEQTVDNRSSMPWAAAAYAQILRYDRPTHGSMFSYSADRSFHGPAIYNGTKYQTLNIEKAEDQHVSMDVTSGWMAAPQHHFVSAVVPPAGVPYQYTLNAQGNEYELSMAGPMRTVAPGAKESFDFKLFVGPKLQAQLNATSPELGRVADYGRLYFLAKPLFWLLEQFHSLFGNWGLSIIVVTFLLKLVFYPLSEASYRSMAKMKTLAPRIKSIQETYKDDKEKAGRAVMELYKREKVNPVAGCLPMIIQIPVFLAFYWVLLESVEMRQAPFFGWINDLSSRDPYFILPAIMALAMFVQYKLNPAPPDPVQAKVMMVMPLAMSVMFAFFPAGLVLYWVTNTILSIAQQWNINRRIEASAKRQKQKA